MFFNKCALCCIFRRSIHNCTEPCYTQGSKIRHLNCCCPRLFVFGVEADFHSHDFLQNRKRHHDCVFHNADSSEQDLFVSVAEQETKHLIFFLSELYQLNSRRQRVHPPHKSRTDRSPSAVSAQSLEPARPATLFGRKSLHEHSQRHTPSCTRTSDCLHHELFQKE